MMLLRPAGRLKSQSLKPAALRRSGWICTSCRHRAALQPSSSRAYSTTPPATPASSSPQDAEASKPYYVTTPIFYVNAAPHIGHMYSMILADVLKRWYALTGRKSLMLTGTDEHGMKIQQAAQANETSPQQWCDLQAAKFKDLALKTNLANDFFMRTTDEDHKQAVRHFWFLLQQEGLIYTSKHEGWYCISDETFYPDAMVERKIDPITGEVFKGSIESGARVEWVEEKNYHFRMTALKDALLRFYAENPDWIVPKRRMAEVVHWVTNNLEDLSISRPSSRLEWGIRVPNDESQTVYVWVDALINYLTKAGFPNWAPGQASEGGWPADVHVIGKDILRFHGVYWPALLLAVGLKPPKRLFSHAHWTMGGRKMSKSLGNVVNPHRAIDRFGVDTMRFFMVYDGGVADDASYDNSMVAERHRKILAGTIGNMLGRTMRSKAWNVRESIVATKEVAPFDMSESNKGYIDLVTAQEASIASLYEKMSGHMETPDPRWALRELVEFGFDSQVFITKTAPWQIAKSLTTVEGSEATELQAVQHRIIYTMAETVRNMGILLQPFIPDKATQLLDTLGVPHDKRDFSFVGVGKDFDYGIPMKDPGRSAHEGLFPPLEVEDEGRWR